jgi:hypothetical protein
VKESSRFLKKAAQNVFGGYGPVALARMAQFPKVFCLFLGSVGNHREWMIAATRRSWR